MALISWYLLKYRVYVINVNYANDTFKLLRVTGRRFGHYETYIIILLLIGVLK